MRNFASVVLLVILATVGIYSQKNIETQTKTGHTIKPDSIELITPWIHNGSKASFSEERRLKSCFDFESLSHDCRRYPAVRYGDRIGVNWDLFHIDGGRIDRTRMVEVGKFNWTDKFTVPYVEPWRELSPGEKRAITVNASGASVPDGAPGRPGTNGVAGMNGDGTYTPMLRPAQVEMKTQMRAGSKSYANASVTEQVSSTVKGADGKVRNDAYSPLIEVKKGYMYVVHVLDEAHDYYMLIHVDELEHGERVVLSFVKLELFAL